MSFSCVNTLILDVLKRDVPGVIALVQRYIFIDQTAAFRVRMHQPAHAKKLNRAMTRPLNYSAWARSAP